MSQIGERGGDVEGDVSVYSSEGNNYFPDIARLKLNLR